MEPINVSPVPAPAEVDLKELADMLEKAVDLVVENKPGSVEWEAGIELVADVIYKLRAQAS